MKKIHYIVLVLLLVPFHSKSQNNINFLLNKFKPIDGTYDDRSDQGFFDIENTPLYTLRRNPAFFHLYYGNSDSLPNNYSLRKMKCRNIIAGHLIHEKSDGDYVFYDGNKKLGGAIFAGGERVIEGLGTLYGSASYSSQQREGVYLNYATNPQDYFPYLVCDTLGAGNITSEKYGINVGFSFRHKDIYYGVGGSYEGIASSKLTDPRLSNYTSWLRLNFGMAIIRKNKLISLKLYPEFNRQNISAINYLRQSAVYFHFYGFGVWKNDEIMSGNRYESLLTIKGVGTDFTIKKLSDTGNEMDYTFNIVYNYRKMETEAIDADLAKTTYKNLFSTGTHHIKPEITLSKKHKDFLFYGVITGDNNIKDGTEYLYDNVKVSNEQGLYAEKKVASNKMYHQYLFCNSVLLKAIYYLSPSHSVHFLGGVKHNHYKETYVFPSKKISNISITPTFGIGYKGAFNKSNFGIYFRIKNRNALNNSFDLSRIDKAVFQYAYIPYLIRGEDNKSVLSEMVYSYSINKKNTIGGRLFLSYQQRTNAPYIAELSSFSERSDRELLKCNLKVFYLF